MPDNQSRRKENEAGRNIRKVLRRWNEQDGKKAIKTRHTKTKLTHARTQISRSHSKFQPFILGSRSLRQLSNACGNICRRIILRQLAIRRSGAQASAGM